MTIPSPNKILPNIMRISGGTATGHILTLIATIAIGLYGLSYVLYAAGYSFA